MCVSVAVCLCGCVHGVSVCLCLCVCVAACMVCLRSMPFSVCLLANGSAADINALHAAANDVVRWRAVLCVHRLDEADRSAWNAIRTDRFWHDPPLTDDGVTMATETGAKLAIELKGMEHLITMYV